MNLLKKLLRKAKLKLQGFSNRSFKAVNAIQLLIDEGKLEIGKDCLFEGFSIHNHQFSTENPQVLIGDECHLMGQIELYSKNAKVIIGNRVFIGPNTKLFCYESINIEDDVMLSWGCTVIDTNAHSLKSEERKNDVSDWKKGYQYKNWSVVDSKPVIIKSKSWIGFNSIITKGVTISQGCVVACGSVVTKTTNEFSVVGGNPAIFIKSCE